MVNRTIALAAAAALAMTGLFASPARADNPMGYRLLSQDEASSLPHNHGGLGLSVQRAQVLTDAGMTFDLMRVSQVRAGSCRRQGRVQAG